MSKNRNVVNALYLIVQPLFLNAVSIPATAYIIRRLGPLGYGQWATAVSIVAVLGFATSLGLRPQFIRAVAQDPENASEMLSHQLGLRIVLTLIAIALAFVVCLCFRYEPIIRACILITASGLLLNTITTTFVDLLQGLQFIKHYAFVNLVAGLTVTAGTVLAVWQNTGPIGLSIAYLIGPITNVCLLLITVFKLHIHVRVRCELSYAIRLLKESHAWTVSCLLSTLRDRLEQLMVPKLVGFEAMGYYTAGSMAADKLQIIPDGLSTAFYPVIAGASQNEEQRYKIQQLITLSVVVCFACAILLNVLAGPLAHILFPKSALYCQYVIQITSLALPFVGLAMPMSGSLIAAGQQSQVARASIYATCVSIAGSLTIVLRGGLYGACWSYVLRSVVPVLFLLPCLAKAFPGILPKIPLVRISVSAGVMALLLQLAIVWAGISPANASERTSNLFFCLFLCIAALTIYTFLLFIFDVVSKEQVLQLIRRNTKSY